MADNSNSGYYQPSLGTITGFDQINTPTGTPQLSAVGWSIEQMRAFLLNQSNANFPSNEWILRVEQAIHDHVVDFNNPHHTTLDQIAPDAALKIIGNIAPGTVPDTIPFYSYDANFGLPLGTIFPATYSTNNLLRQTSGGWFVDPATESEIIGVDHSCGRAGIPLFNSLTNLVPASATAGTIGLNTTLTASTDTTINYPFGVYDVAENPVNGLFGIDLPITENLQIAYTATFMVRPSAQLGTLRIFQPGDPANYIDVNLADGSFAVYSTIMTAMTYRYTNGVIRISLNFTSLAPVADGKLRMVHLNPNQTGDGTRQGSNGRVIFSIMKPQANRAAIGQPSINVAANPSSTTPFVTQLSKVNAPATLPQLIFTAAFSIYPTPPTVPVQDGTILSFGPLLITRDQVSIRVSVNGTLIFTTDILQGYNVISLSYSPTQLIFKDLRNARQTANGTYPALPTNNVYLGTFGGYLHRFAFYGQSDQNQILEFLTNG